MRTALKIFASATLFLLLSTLGVGVYFYQTNPRIRAMVENDESVLYYFPSKAMQPMDDLPHKTTCLTVDDSLKIYTYQFEPSTPKKANIFFIHGAGGNVSTAQYLIRPLIENGFGVYVVDWRGYGKSNGKPSYRGVMKDTEAGFAHFIGSVKPEQLKTIVYGCSLGGQLAVKITKDHQREVDALVLDGAVESAQRLAMAYAPVGILKAQIEQSPEKFNQEYVAVRDIAMIKAIPKLIIHSKNDQQVPLSHGENLFNAAYEPKNLWVTETAHIQTLKVLTAEAIDRIEALIKE